MGQASGVPDRLPRGAVTFLFSDIEGSTQLLQRLGDLYPDVLETHRRLLRQAWERNYGIEVSTEGDSFFVVFEKPSDAVAAALEGQALLAEESWPAGEQVRVRMGLHTGEAVFQAGDYVGISVHEAAPHGGQVLISSATRTLLADRLAPDAVEDLGEHRLKDLAPQRIFEVRHPHLPAGLPPIRSLSVLPNNLPQLPTTFVGRENEMAEIKDLLGAHRLVTLTGIGGTGKTRLSLQVAGDLSDRFKDGVWFVELAPLNDGSLVEAAIGSVLGIRETPGRPLIETINARIRHGEMLIILDNAEHIVDACARVADSLLTRTVRPRLFVTSRERLGVAGEQLYPVPSLGRPDPSASPEELAEAESVRLFIDRVALSRPGFVLDGSAGVVGEICRRLDGIPLAIELAAARVSVLEPHEILRRLDDRFRLLVGGARTAQPRQQTLRAAIDWSYELLTTSEKNLLSRLSVFAGGFELAAAEAVCSGGPIEEGDVLQLMAQLVDKSLVVPHAAGRYELLETIREYAREKLVAAEELELVAERHLAWCISFAERADKELHGRGQIEWLDRVEVEHDNMRAALDTAADLDPAAGLRLAAALGFFWWLRTYWREGSARLVEALRTGPTSPTKERADALGGAAGIAYMHSDYATVRRLNEEALSISRSLGGSTWGGRQYPVARLCRV